MVKHNTHVHIVDVIGYQVAILIGREHIISTLERHRPVHQEKVEILEAQIIQ